MIKMMLKTAFPLQLSPLNAPFGRLKTLLQLENDKIP